jgi:hypothetical protein
MSVALTTTHENGYFQRSCHVPWDTTTYENGLSLPATKKKDRLRQRGW